MSEDVKANGASHDPQDQYEKRLALLTSSVSDIHGRVMRVEGDVGAIMPAVKTPKEKLKEWFFQNLTWVIGAVIAGFLAYTQWHASIVEERLVTDQFRDDVKNDVSNMETEIRVLKDVDIKGLNTEIAEIKAFEVLQYEEQRRLLLENLPSSKRKDFIEEPKELKEAKKALLKD